MKQNNPCYLFGMYEPDTNSVIINAINDSYSGTPLISSCEKCNSAVLLDTPNDIAYLSISASTGESSAVCRIGL